MARARTPALAALAAAVALFAVGCGDDGSATQTDTTAAPPAATTTTTAEAPTTTASGTETVPPPSTTATCKPPPGADTTGRRGGNPSETMFLTDVSAAGNGCVDRVEFTFRPDRAEEPGYAVEYRPRESALIEDGSGTRLQASGTAFLVVRLHPAATAEASDSGDLVFTYKGPRRLRPTDTTHVRELLKTGDFEAVLTWAIGLDGKRPFRVSTSGTPPRLVVEIG